MKCGLRGLTGILIKEARPFGVKVTAVYPGGTDTDSGSSADPISATGKRRDDDHKRTVRPGGYGGA